jgi:hypothetical protein
MPYIGKNPSNIRRSITEKDTFTGDGSTTTFDVSSNIPAGSGNDIQVFVNDVRKFDTTDYTVGLDGANRLRRITFTSAPTNGHTIVVLNPGVFDSQITTVADSVITSAKIADGSIVNADINSSAAISDTKLAQITTASKVATSSISQPGSSSVYLSGDGSWGAIDTSQQDTNAFNISLLGFKMAVNEGLTVFNLVDGVVDEFNDESGTDEAEGSNDRYVADSDYYINNTSDQGISIPTISAGFTTTTVTEPDTSTAGTNPAYGTGTFGSFTVPSDVTTVNVYTWGAGGGHHSVPEYSGGGGFASGTLAVSPGQTIEVVVGEGGSGGDSDPNGNAIGYGYTGNAGSSPEPNSPGTNNVNASGGGLSGLFNPAVNSFSTMQNNAPNAPGVFLVAGGGGSNNSVDGGAAGGLQGYASGGGAQTANTNSADAGGGGSQTQGGQGATNAQSGRFLQGGLGTTYVEPGPGNTYGIGGGAGFYGGGGGGWHYNAPHGGSGGGSSYYGNPQISSGATTAGSTFEGGGVSSPFYVAGTNEGKNGPSPQQSGEDGYVLIENSDTAVTASVTSTTIVSSTFTSSAEASSARIVVFEENIDTPTLNTDIIASVSRDGGTTFSTATLTDSGYVTGSSGQRILTGQADISGQPTGQSMRWKLALANNTVKIHGVSLQWA